MLTKACTNSKCPAYAHFVYTVAMRCVLCRWDLQSAQRISEVAGDQAGLTRKNSSSSFHGKSSGAHASR
jgi:hypothetical protein